MKLTKKLKVILLLTAILILGMTCAAEANTLASTDGCYDTIYMPTKQNYVVKQSGAFRVLNSSTTNKLWIPFKLSTPTVVSASFNLGTLYALTPGNVYYQVLKVNGKDTQTLYTFRYNGNPYGYTYYRKSDVIQGHTAYLESHSFTTQTLPAGNYNILISCPEGAWNNVAVQYQITDNASPSDLPTSVYLNKGETREFSTFSYSGVKQIYNVISSNISVAAASSINGGYRLRLYGGSEGEAYVSVYFTDGTSQTIYVAVTDVTSTKIRAGKTLLTVGDQTTAYLQNCESPLSVTWSSDNTNVATVSAPNPNTGVVTITGKDKGTCKITAKYKSKTYTQKITVDDSEYPVFKTKILSINPARKSVKVRVKNLESSPLKFYPSTGTIYNKSTELPLKALRGKGSVTVGAYETKIITLRTRSGKIPSRKGSRYFVEMDFEYRNIPYIVRVYKRMGDSMYAYDHGGYIEEYEWWDTY